MCKCAETSKNNSCGCWKKWLLIGIAAVVAIVGGYWYWKKKRVAA